MRAICLVTTKPGKVDSTVASIKKKRKAKKNVTVVTGRADICIFLKGNLDEINSAFYRLITKNRSYYSKCKL